MECSISNKPKSRTEARVYGVILIASGCVLLLWSVWYCHVASSSIDWPITTGRILSVRDGVNRGAEAEFEYWVNGRRYVSNRVAFPARFIPPRLSAAFPVGSAINVRYDPENSSTSVLIPGSLPDQYLLFLGPICMFFFGYCLLREEKLNRRKRMQLCDLLEVKPRSLALAKKGDKLVIRGGFFRVRSIIVSCFQAILVAALVEVFIDLLEGRVTIVWGVGVFVLLFLLPLIYAFFVSLRVEVVMMTSGVSIHRRRHSDSIVTQNELTCLYSALDQIVFDDQSNALILYLANGTQADINARDGFSRRELIWLKDMIECARLAAPWNHD